MSISENPYAPSSAESAQLSEQHLGAEEFGKLVGIERQTVSYHLRKGALKRWVENGRILTDPYRIPADLVEWFLAQPSAKSAKVYAARSAPLPQGNAQVYAPPAQTLPQAPAQNDALTQKILELADKVMAQADEIVKAKAEIEAKRSDLVILNNERANYNSALQSRQETQRELDHARGELEALRKENQAMKEQLEAAKKPAWKFW